MANLIKNAGLEAAFGNWQNPDWYYTEYDPTSVLNGTIARSTIVPYAGTYCGVMTIPENVPSGSYAMVTQEITDYVIGETYKFGLRYKHASNQTDPYLRPIYLHITATDAAWGTLQNWELILQPTDSWTYAELDGITVPAGTAHLQLTFDNQGLCVFQFDDVVLDVAVMGDLSLTATLDGTPVNASVTSDGETATTPVTVSLAPGTYAVTATYGGQTQTVSLTVVANETTVYNFAFVSAIQQAYITVTASIGGTLVGASVSLDGLSGTTPVTFAVLPGTYLITAAFSGETLTQSVTVADQETATRNFAFTPSMGFINVVASSNGIAIGASVTADGQSGTTPVMFSFPPGTYTITATYAGETPAPQMITLLAGQVMPVAFTFAPTTIMLSVINATPASGLYMIGEMYTFTAATPPIGQSFDHWDLSGENKGSTDPLSLTVTFDMDGKLLQPIYTTAPPPKITLNITVAGNGTTDITGGEFNVGDTVTVKAIPKAGATFNGWKLDGSAYSTDNPLNLTITADLNGKTLTADFTVPIPGFPTWVVPVGVVGALIGWYVLTT